MGHQHFTKAGIRLFFHLPQHRLRLFGAVAHVAQGAFRRFTGVPFVMQRGLRLAPGLIGELQLFTQGLQLLFGAFRRFAQLGQCLFFPLRDFDRFDSREFGMADFGLQRGDLRVRVVQGPFGAFTRGRFSGERGFGSLETTRLRGLRLAYCAAAHDGDGNFPVLHEAAPVETLPPATVSTTRMPAALGTKSVGGANGLVRPVMVRPRAHSAVKA